MNVKLTLRLDQRLIRRAKAHARRTGKSVSQVVAEYFSLLGTGPDVDASNLTPTVRSLKGSLRGGGADKTTYRRHLEARYR